MPVDNTDSNSMSGNNTDSVVAITRLLTQHMADMDKKFVIMNDNLGLTMDNKLGQMKTDLTSEFGDTIDTKLNKVKVNLSTELQHSPGVYILV